MIESGTPNKEVAERLTDSFGRKHDYLRISLTERCNLRCFYCMPEEGIPLRPKHHFMRTEEIVSLARTFVDLGVKKIRLTGGEPLVRKDAESIMRQLSELPIELAITTNGVLLDRFFKCFDDCGIRSVNVSLDSLQRKKMAAISRFDLFDRIMCNIKQLINRGFEVKVNTVVMRGVNDNEIVDFIEWTRNTPVHVRFIEFMPFDGNRWKPDSGLSMDEILQTAMDNYGPSAFHRTKDRKNDTSKNFRLAGAMGTFAIIGSVTGPFCSSCNRLRLTADGKLKNCLFSAAETDLLHALRSGQDILPLIAASVQRKRPVRAGMDSLQNLSDPLNHGQNRSMVAIGG